MENKEDNVKNKQEPKLPIYFEQVRNLMNWMVKYHTEGEGIKYLSNFKMLYSRIRPDLKKDQQEYFDDKLKQLKETKTKIMTGKNKYGYSNEGIWINQNRYFCDFVFKVELKLFQAMEDAGVFKILKQSPEDFELRGV